MNDETPVNSRRRALLAYGAALGSLGGLGILAFGGRADPERSPFLVKRKDGRERVPPGQTPGRLAPPEEQAALNAESLTPAATEDFSAETSTEPADSPPTQPAGPTGSVNDPYSYDDRLRNASGELLSATDRITPGQDEISSLRQMRAAPRMGDPSRSRFNLKVYGEVETPFELSFLDLLKLPQTEMVCDIHCVTRWTVLDVAWLGVMVKQLADRAGVKKNAKHVIFEAQHGYTANVPIDRALAEDSMIAHRLNGGALPGNHGGPVRNVIPDLYFWKSAKWLTGIRFVEKDEPGYWEVRGYHNRADPWKEERFDYQEQPGMRPGR